MKNTFFRICLFAAIALCAQFATADYLYCLVGDSGGNAPKYSYDPTQSVSYNFATVVMIKDDGSSKPVYLPLYAGGEDAGEEATPSGWSMDAESTEPLYAKLPENYETNYNTFLFELWTAGQDTSELVAWQRFSLDEVKKGGHIVDGSAQGTTLYVTSVIPEPTGGVLMLLGMAVLAIRRKDIKDLN